MSSVRSMQSISSSSMTSSSSSEISFNRLEKSFTRSCPRCFTRAS
ncbi:MAG: hypothetical protein R3F14_03350 [Polyangiaceae bacterium]